MATKPRGKKPAPEQAPNQPTKPARPTKGSAGSVAPGKRQRADWEAVERDYRTGNFSDGELAVKHSLSRESIVRARKRDQAKDPTSWAQDLGPQVRAATNALLMKEMVADKITEGHINVTGAVLVTAEVNKTVILGHRKDITSTRNVAAALLDELADSALLAQHKELLSEILAGDGAEPVDVARAQATVRKALDVGARVASVKALAETFTKLQAMERQAFNLDAPEKEPGDGDRPKLTDAERAVRLARLMKKAES